MKLYVKNLPQLTPNNIKEEMLELRKIGLKSLEIALSSVEPKKLVHNAVKVVKDKLIVCDDPYDLSVYREILIIGGGKASARMALAVEEILERYHKISDNSIINVPNNLDIKNSFISSKIRVNLASHPIPDESGLNGTNLMFNHIENTTKDDLIIFLLSGGGSALLPMPKHSISLKDLHILPTKMVLVKSELYPASLAPQSIITGSQEPILLFAAFACGILALAPDATIVSNAG